MFVTLEEFFDNYRIKNQQHPNETVLNRGIMRLKREIRELKSMIDVFLGRSIPLWNSDNIYEKDEYVSYNNLTYKSLTDTNMGILPTDEENWVIVSNEFGIYTVDQVDTAIERKQKKFVTAPTTSKGKVGDLAGDIAVDAGYIYYCKSNYTNGTTNIWVKAPFTVSSW